MDVYVTSIELARSKKLPASEIQQLEDRATEISSQLESRPNYLWGRATRLVFYRLMNRNEEYEKDRSAIVQQGFGGDQRPVAQLLLDEQARLQAYAKNNPHSFAAKTALALRKVIDGDGESVSGDLEKLKDEFTDLNQCWLMLDVALIAQDPALARQLAREFLRPGPTKRIDSLNSSDRVMTDFYAGNISEKELLAACGPFLVERSVGQYAIGMWKLANAESAGDVEVARQHLKIAADCPIPGWWHVEFAMAYLQLMDEGRLPRRRALGAT